MCVVKSKRQVVGAGLLVGVGCGRKGESSAWIKLKSALPLSLLVFITDAKNTFLLIVL